MRFLLCIGFFLSLFSHAEVTEVLPIFQNKCGSCHRGPFLDFTSYPFYSDKFKTEKDLLEEVALRVQGIKKTMPPANGKPLTPEEKEQILHWIQN